MAEYDGSVRIKTDISTKQAKVQLSILENKIEKTSKKIASLRSKMDSLGETKIPTKEYEEIQKQIEDTEKKLNSLISRREKFLETGGKEKTSTFKRMNYDIEELENSLEYAKGELQDLVDTGKAFTFGSDTQEYADISQKLKDSELELEKLTVQHEKLSGTISQNTGEYVKLGAAIKNAFSGIGSVVTSAPLNALQNLGSVAKGVFNNIPKWIGKASRAVLKFSGKVMALSSKAFPGLGKSSDKSNKSLMSGFKTILKYGLGIRSLYVLFNKLRSALVDGMNNLVQYSSSANSSISSIKSALTQLKNSVATAFEPILTVASPALVKLINLLTEATNKMAQFLAALTGKSTYTKAIAVQEDYAESLNNTASAAKKAVNSLYAFDELNVVSKDTDTGTSGTGGTGAGGFTTEEVATEYSDLAEQVKETFGKVFDVFKQAWENKGAAVITEAKAAFSSLKTLIQSIGTTLFEVWTDGTGQAYVESLLELLRAALGVIKSIATSFTTAWNSGAGEANVRSIFDMLTNVNALLTAIADSFSKAFSSQAGVDICTNLLTIFTGIYNTVGNLAGSFTKAWESAGLGDSILQGIANILATASTHLANIATATAEWAANIDFTPVLKSIDGLLKAIEPLTDTIGKGLEWVYTNVLLPLASWTIEKGLPTVVNLLSAAVSALSAVAEAAGPILEEIWENFFKPIAGYVADGFIFICEKLTEFFNYLSKHKDVATIVGGIAIAIAALAIAFKVLTNPITLAIAAIVAIVAAIGLLSTKWGELVQWWNETAFEDGEFTALGLLKGILSVFLNIGKWIKDHIFQPFIDGFKKVFGIASPSKVMKEQGKFLMQGLLKGISGQISKITKKFREMKTKILEKISEIKDAMGKKWDGIKKATGEKWELIKGTISTKLTNAKTTVSTKAKEIKDKLSEKWEDAKTVTSNKWESIKKTIGTKLTNAKTTVSTKAKEVKDTLSSKWEDAKTVTSTKWESVRQRVENKLTSTKRTVATKAKEVKDKLSEKWEDAKTMTSTKWESVRTRIESKLKSTKTTVSAKAKEVKDKLSDRWESAKKVTTTKWESIRQRVENKLAETKTTVSTNAGEVKDTLAEKWEEAKTSTNESWGEIKESVSGCFTGIWDAIKPTINSILSGVESMANGVIKGFNAMIKALNKLSFTIPDWVPKYGGKKFSLGLKEISEVSIPRLATGTVVPPNKEFMAVLGDNKKETEVVSPLSTMKQALKEAMSEYGGDIGQSGDVYISAEGDMDAIVRLLKFKLQNENKRVGRNFEKVITA